MQVTNKTFALDMDKPADFHPWSWERRLADAAAVAAFTAALPQDWTESKKHTDTLKYMAKELKSRQAEEPALGKLVETATVDPLHVMNNAWEHLLRCILGRCLAISQFRTREDLELQPNSPIARLMSLLKDKLRLHRLHRKLYDWLREECAKDKGAQKLRIRLNGMESRTFSQHVMDLVDCMFPATQDLPQHLFHVHALAYIGLKLRDAIALFSRYKITTEQLKDLKSSCRLYFNACKVLLDRPITPTIWIIGHVVPAQAEKLNQEIGYGLGMGTTQGREGKVQVAKKYLVHTTPANKFKLFFRHEYMHLVWLAQYDPEEDNYHASKESYLPPGVEEKTACHCGRAVPDGQTECDFCCHELRHVIVQCADTGAKCDAVDRYLS